MLTQKKKVQTLFTLALALFSNVIFPILWPLEVRAATPTIDSYTPADDATGVSTTANLVIDLDQPISNTALPSYAYIKQLSNGNIFETINLHNGNVTYAADIVTIDPVKNFQSNTGYYVEYPNHFCNMFAECAPAISGSTTWNFTTDDTDPPVVQSFTPPDDTTYVSISTNLEILFDENIDIANGNLIIKNQSDDSIFETIDVNLSQVTGNGTATITINPSSDFAYGNGYYIEIDSNAFEDESGNAYAGFTTNGTWNFNTIADANDRYWVGSAGGNTNDTSNWADGANTCGNGGGASVPGSSSLAIFGNLCNNDATVNANFGVEGILFDTGYNGTVTQSSGFTITTEADGFYLYNGNFIGGDSTITVDSPLYINGATFTSTTGTLRLDRATASDETMFFFGPSSTFNHSNGLTWFYPNGSVGCGTTDSEIDITGVVNFFDVQLSPTDSGTCGSNDRRVNLLNANSAIVENGMTFSIGQFTGEWILKGNLYIESTASSSSAIVTMNGDTDQFYSRPSGSGAMGSIYIDKLNGDVLANGGTSSFSMNNLHIYNGDFYAPTGTLRVGDNTYADENVIEVHNGGRFFHNNGNVNFNPNGGTCATYTYSIDADGSIDFYDLNINQVESGSCGPDDWYVSHGAGDVINVLNGFTHTDGRLLSDWYLQGDVLIKTTAVGTSGSLRLIGPNNQTYTDEGGNEPNGDFYIDKSAGTVTMASNGDWGSGGQDLYIQGGTLYTNGHDIDTNNLYIENGAKLLSIGIENFSGVLNHSFESNSTVEYIGNGGPYTIMAFDHGNLVLNGNGGIFNLTNHTGVNGDLSILQGTLDVTGLSYRINLAGDWINNASFTAQSGEVVLDGVNQSITGSTSFYDFTKIESANDSTDETLTFKNGDTFTFTGTLTLNGTDADDRINLVSSDPGNQFTVNPSSYNLDFLEVTDSVNISASTLDPANSLDGGNTVKWFSINVISFSPPDDADYVSLTSNLEILFDTTIDIQNGNITIKDANGDTVFETIDVNSAQVTGNGTATIIINPSSNFATATDYYVEIDSNAFASTSGNPYSGFTDNGTWNFNTVADANDRYWVGSAGGNTNDTSNWAEGANSCGNGGGASVPGTSSLAIFGNLCNNDATINANFNVQGILIDSGYNGTITQASGVTITTGSNDFYQYNGTFLGGDSTIDVNSPPLYLAGGSFTATSGRLEIYRGALSGSETVVRKRPLATFLHNNGTIVFNASGTTCSYPQYYIDTNGDINFHNLELNMHDGGCNGIDQMHLNTYNNGSVIIDNDINHIDGRFSGDFYLHGNLNLMTGPDLGRGNIHFVGTTDQKYSSDNTGSTASIVINKPSGNVRPESGTAYLGANALTIINGDFTAPSNGLTLSGINDYYKLNLGLNGNFLHNNGTVTINPVSSAACSNVTFYVNGDFTFYNFNAASSDVGSCNGVDQYTTGNKSSNGIIVLNGMSLTDGRLSGTWNLFGDYISSTGSKPGSAILRFLGANGQNFQADTGTYTTGDLYINKSAGTLTMASNGDWDSGSQDVFIQGGTLFTNGYDLYTNNLNMDNGTKLLAIGTEDFTGVSSNSFQVNSTVEYIGNGGTYSIRDFDYANLIFNGNGATFNLTNNTDINGDLSILQGSLDATGSNYRINLAGDWINNATFTAQSGEVVLDGVNQSITGSTSFYDFTKIESANDSTDETLTFKNGDTFTFTGTLTLNGTDADDRINLVSSDPGNQFTVNPSSYNLDFLEVTDSVNISASALDPANSLDGGNTVKWFGFGNWSDSIKITILASEVNGDVNEFPVYLNFKDLPSSFFSTVNGTGADIRITQGDQLTETAFELVSLDTTNGEGELWFKAPHLSSSVDNTFYLFYGNAGATAYSASSTYGSENVWSNGFVAVYHLNEDPTGTILDSTQFSNNGTSAGSMTSSDLVNAKLGKAIDFDGSDDHLALSTLISLDGNYTISFQASLNSFDSSFVSEDSAFGDDFRVQSSNDTFRYRSMGDNVQVGGVSGATGYDDGIIRKFDLTRDSSLVSFYIDHSLIGTATPAIADFDIQYIGESGWANMSGYIDDMTVANVFRGLDWQKTEFSNQDAPGNFYLINNGDDAGFEQSFWSNKHRITILASEVNGDLTDFPVYVDLSHLPPLFFNTVNGTGADIRITTDDQSTQVPFELVELDTVNGDGELWFKAPSLSSSTDTDFYLWYGNSTANAYDRDDEFGSENVWTEGFLGVWHMNEDPTGSMSDSTSYQNDGTSAGSMTTADLVNGQLGNSIDFDGTDDVISNSSSSVYAFGTNDFTWSVWTNFDNFTNYQHTVSVSGNQNLGVLKTDRDGVNPGDVYYYDSSSGGTNGTINGDNLVAGEWNLLHFTRDSSNGKLFIDGSFVGQKGSFTRSFASHYYAMGSGTGSEFTDGKLDEIRVANVTRNADWTMAEYINQNGAANFYNIDNGIEDFDPNKWSNSLKVTILASEVNGDVSEFPIHLNLQDFPASFFSTVNGTGADIRVTQGDQLTQTAFELVSLDTTNGEGELWFKAPFLSSSTDNTFYVFYGNSDSKTYLKDSVYGSQEVWSNGFVAVYHLNEDPTGVIIDSTGNFDSAQVGSMASDDLIDGKTGKAYFMDTNYLRSADSNTYNGNLSLSVWAKAIDQDIVGWRGLTSWHDTSHWSKQYVFQAAFTGIALTTDGSGPAVGPLSNWDYYFGVGDGTNIYTQDTNIDTHTDNKWRQFYVVLNRGDLNTYFYINDELESTLATPTLNGITMTHIQPAINYNTWTGDMDEVRYSDKDRDREWIATEYSAQNAPGNFYIINNGDDAGFEQSFWPNKHKITVLASEVNGDLTDFPVYVDLGHLPSAFYSIVDNNGADIRMTTDDLSTQVAFEIVELDIANGAGELWFKAPSLSSTIDTDFYLWYGNPTAVAYDRDDEFGSENVWTEGYIGVWHMNENPTGAINDSTSNRFDMTSAGSMTGSDLVTGQLGNSLDFDGSDDYLDAGDIDHSNNNTTTTVKLWFNNSGSGSNQMLFNQPNTAHSDSITALRVASDNTLTSNIWYSGFGNQQIGNGDLGTSTWQEINMVLDHSNTERKLYINSILNDSDNQPGDGLYPFEELHIGANRLGADNVSGLIDQVEISNLARSPDWIDAEYQNQKEAKDFYNIDNGIEDHGEGWVSTNWSDRLKITVNSTEVNGSHTDFPVFIDLSDLPTSFFATVQADGEDIRITAYDGQTRLPFELVYIDTTLERGELHFKAPQITDVTDTHFYIYYGNANARMPNGASNLGSQAVWSNGYLAVYHMHEDPSTATALIFDSTANRNHGNPNGSMTLTDLVNGQMGYALDFDGGDDYISSSDQDYLSFGDSTNDSALNISAWSKPDSLGAFAGIVAKDNGTDREWCLLTSSVSSRSRFFIKHLGGNSQQSIDSTNNLSTVQWNYINASYDGRAGANAADGISMYLDGFLEAPTTVIKNAYTAMSDTSAELTIGQYNSNYLDGLVDEVRISDRVKSADWVHTEYNNQNSPSTFYSIAGSSENKADTSNPKILELIPPTKTLRAPRRHPLRMIFDQVVNKATGFINIYQENGNIFEAIDISTGQVTGDGTDTLIITPSTYFTKTETYYVLIDPTAIRNAANEYFEGIVDAESWKFTIQGGRRDERPLFIFDGMI